MSSNHLRSLIEERQITLVLSVLAEDRPWSDELEAIERDNDETDNETRNRYNL